MILLRFFLERCDSSYSVTGMIIDAVFTSKNYKLNKNGPITCTTQEK
jgi:hypothetical protein